MLAMIFPILLLVTVCIIVVALGTVTKPRHKFTIRYTELQIRLYERQMEAREAMGEKYLHHPVHHVRRIDDRLSELALKEAIKNYCENSESWFPDPPKLRLVK